MARQRVDPCIPYTRSPWLRDCASTMVHLTEIGENKIKFKLKKKEKKPSWLMRYLNYIWILNWINSDRTSCVRSAPRYGDVGTWHWQLLARGQHWWPRWCHVQDFLLIHRDRENTLELPKAGEHLKGHQQCGLSPQCFSLPCWVSNSEARSWFTLEKRVLVGARGPSWWASTSIQSKASH